MIARMRWNAEIETGDTPKVEELAQKHNLTVEVATDDAAGVTTVTVEGSQGAARKLFDELRATNVVQES
jgi:hypothetical protein